MDRLWHLLGLEETNSSEKSLFFFSIILILGLASVGIFSPETLDSVMTGAFDFVLNYFGWWFILLSVILMAAMLAFSFSKYGKLRIGGQDSEPEFGYFSWISMIFTVGFASAVIFWGVAEPIYIVSSPPDPLPIQGAPVESVALAFMYTHNIFPAIMAWYLPISLAFGLIVWDDDEFKFSSMLKPILDEDRWGSVYYLTDLMALVTMIGGLATTLGFIGQQVSTIMSNVFGFNSGILTYGLFGLIGLIFLGDVWLGLRDGIRNMARATMVIIGILMAVLIGVGPSMFIAELGLDSLGVWLNNLPRLMLYTDPVERSLWPQDWTSFWWAWYAAWGLFVGSFVARVSKGRTVRETTIGLSIVPAGFLFVQHAILGGWALSSGNYGPISTALTENGIPAALAEAINITPLTGVLGVLFILALIGYIITSLDSAVFMLAAVSMGNEEPNVRNRAIWGLVLAALGAMTLSLPGTRALESFSVVLGLPFTVFFLVILYSMLVTARKQYKSAFGEPVPRNRTVPDSRAELSDDDD